MGRINQVINKIFAIRQLPLFKKLNWLDLHAVASRCQFVAVNKGDIIYEEGSPPDAFYYLVSGRLQAYVGHHSQQKTKIEYIHRGMYFGIVALLTGEPHHLTFEAINDSVLLKVDKEDFQDILTMIPALGVEFSRSLSRRIKSQNKSAKTIFESTIISVYSPAKGVGSSTYAANLALQLQKETGKRTILLSIDSMEAKERELDSDVREASPQWKKGTVDLKAIIGDEGAIANSIIRGRVDIELLSVQFDPQDSSLIAEISPFVSFLANDYHYIVVDLPNRMDDVVMETLEQSDIVQLFSLDRENDLQKLKDVSTRLKQNLGENMNYDRVQVIVRGQRPKCYLSYEEINQAVGYDIYTVLPAIHRQDLNKAIISEEFAIITPSPDSEYAREIRRIARTIGGVLVGLVLGGGAALGLSHIGVLKVLERENIPIDIVVGSSMGALLSSLWAIGYDARQLNILAHEFARTKDLWKLVDPALPKSGLIRGKKIRRWLESKIGSKTFYSTRMPLKIVAYDLTRREEIVIGEGSLVDAVCQSIAIPGIIKPIRRQEKVIIDGGVLNPLPTNVLTAMGIKKIIAVNVLQSPEMVSKSFDIAAERMAREREIPFGQAPLHYVGVRIRQKLLKVFSPNIPDIIVNSLQATEYVIAQQNATLADIVIQPDTTGIDWFELYRVDDLIRRGEEAARAAIAEITSLVHQGV